MKVKQLLAELQLVDPEMDVYVEADHGQDIEGVFASGVVNVHIDDREVCQIHDDDLDEYELGEVEQVFLIQG